MITVSLETAKKLKESGWKKETYFAWVEGGKLGQPLRSEVHPTEVMKNRIVLADSAYDSYLAPTADEITAILEQKLLVDGDEFFLQLRKYPSGYVCGYFCNRKNNVRVDNILGFQPVRDSLAEAAASCRLRCKENNHIT